MPTARARNNGTNGHEQLRVKIRQLVVELRYLEHCLATRRANGRRSQISNNDLRILASVINIGIDSSVEHLSQSPGSLLAGSDTPEQDWASLRADLAEAPSAEAYLRSLSRDFLNGHSSVECLAKAVCSLAGDI